jgi:hypothetical protein
MVDGVSLSSPVFVVLVLVLARAIDCGWIVEVDCFAHLVDKQPKFVADDRNFKQFI